MAKTHVLLPQQYAAVSALAGPLRYEHFIARVADWERIWGLRNDSGWVVTADESGNPGFPVWPHAEYALACATGEWTGNLPEPIDVHDFVENWLPDIAAKQVFVAVFPTPTMCGVPVSGLALQAQIRHELSQIE